MVSGAVEAQLAVKRNGDGQASTKVEYMKDGPEGDEIHFRLEQVELGTDEDGDQITSCIVREAEASATSERGRKLTPNQSSYLRCLQDAMPQGLDSEEWNEKARATGLDFKRRATFTDLKNALKDKGRVHETQGRWFITTR